MLLGLLDGARSSVQVDIGFGDAVTPAPEQIRYPVMLSDFPAPELRAYPRYTVVAEKFEALVSLGIANSRMKDYFDLWTLACHTDFDGELLHAAIHATFGCRNTPITEEVPFGLTDAFAENSQKQIQWKAFLRKNALTAVPLTEVIIALRDFLLPPIDTAPKNKPYERQWHAGTGWK